MVVESTEPEYTKSDDELKWFARDYLRLCENKEYRRLRREGTLENYLQERVGNSSGTTELFVRVSSKAALCRLH